MSADTQSQPPGGSAKVHSRLQERGIDHEMLEHPATYTAASEAAAVDVPAGGVAKTLVAVDHDDVWLAVVPASRDLDLRRLRDHVGASTHLRLATEDEIRQLFREFDVGATPPLGELVGVREVVDPLLLAHDSVVCSAGDHEHAVRLSPEALLAAARPAVADISTRVEEREDRWRRFGDTPSW